MERNVKTPDRACLPILVDDAVLILDRLLINLEQVKQPTLFFFPWFPSM